VYQQKSLRTDYLDDKDRRTSVFAELFSQPNFENYFRAAETGENTAASADGTGANSSDRGQLLHV
jgi:hypothetical protein